MTADPEVLLDRARVHLANAMAYAARGKKAFFDEGNPDTRRLVEAELRKAYENVNKLGASFWSANPSIDRAVVGKNRQLLTHDYADADPTDVWQIARDDAQVLFRQLSKAKVRTAKD